MPDVHEDAELAPRDVVARAVEREHEETGEVVLDVSPLDFETTFPDLAALCDDHDVDPSRGIPVVPAEHFLCGGIDVDTRGRTTIDRLYAVGECARTGVHGANRLASTSLLEGLVWGLRAGRDGVGQAPPSVSSVGDARTSTAVSDEFVTSCFRELRKVMDAFVGLRRTADGLRRAETVLQDLKTMVEAKDVSIPARSLSELKSACTVGLLIVRAALDNEHSVGCHYRIDAPPERSSVSKTQP